MKEKIISIFLIIASLSVLLGISGNAYQRYTYSYTNANNEKQLSVFLWTEDPVVKDNAEMKIWNAAALNTYNYGVVTASISGYVDNRSYVYWTVDYDAKKAQYNNKSFTDTMYADLSGVGSSVKSFAKSDLLPSSCHILYVAGKYSSHSTTTHNCSFDYFDNEYMVFGTRYFSKVVYGNISTTWSPY